MSTSQKELINVSFPYDSIIDESSILIRLELELQYLIIDCLYIHRALIIYMNNRKTETSSSFTEYFDSVNEALVYRIIHGLTFFKA